MQVNFPGNCTSPADRMAWCERCYEVLQKVHNGMGEWYKEGLTEVQYDKFPNKVKNRYAYKAQLTEAEFKDFDNKVFDPVMEAIHEARNKNKGFARESTTWSPDLDGDIS